MAIDDFQLTLPNLPTVKKPAISQGNRGDHPDSATGRKGGGFSIQLAFSCSPLIRIYQNNINLLLMEEILHELIGSLSHYFQGFIHPRWCRISSINSIIWKKGLLWVLHLLDVSWCVIAKNRNVSVLRCFKTVVFLKEAFQKRLDAEKPSSTNQSVRSPSFKLPSELRRSKNLMVEQVEHTRKITATTNHLTDNNR